MPAGVPALVPCHARGFPGWQKVEQEFSLPLVYRHGRLRKGVMSKNPKNKIVVLVIEDKTLKKCSQTSTSLEKYGVVDLGTFMGTPLSISIWSIGNGARVLRCDRPMGTDEPSS